MLLEVFQNNAKECHKWSIIALFTINSTHLWMPKIIDLVKKCSIDETLWQVGTQNYHFEKPLLILINFHSKSRSYEFLKSVRGHELFGRGVHERTLNAATLQRSSSLQNQQHFHHKCHKMQLHPVGKFW